MADQLVLCVYLDGVTGKPQVSLNHGNGGYRLLGPKFNGTGELLGSRILSERDANEIRRMLNAVFPQDGGGRG